MFVNFKRMKLKNLLSYGNTYTEIDFTYGLNLIKAPNGSGKSAFLDAINFGLFGKPFRSIKINELINRYNKKGLEVIIEFSIGKDEYILTRGLKPNLFSLTKNGENLESLSSKKLNQEEINKIIGIDEKLFKNIVGVAVTNSKPFLSMGIADKRSLIESIFNIDVLTMMLKEVKKRDSLNKTEQRIKVSELDGYDNSIVDNENYIKRTSEYIEQFDKQKELEIKQIENELSLINSNISRFKGNIQKGLGALESLTVNDTSRLVEQLNDVVANVKVVNNNKNSINRTLSNLDGAVKCPLCDSKLDEGHALEHLEQLKTEIDVIENKTLPELYKQQTELNEKIEKEKAIKNRYDLINQKVKEEETKLSYEEEKEISYTQKLNQLKEKKCDLDIKPYEDKLSELKLKKKEIEVYLSKLEEETRIDMKLIEMLGDDGLRSFFFNKLLPILNQKINDYLTKFELNINIEIDSLMNETITVGHYTQSYNQFSNGEKSRIDMAILLSFYDISKIISNWSCSILFIDEVLDAGVDLSGTEQFLTTLYNIVTEENTNLGIYLISHKLAEIQMSWNEVIEVKKKNLFSEIVKEV